MNWLSGLFDQYDLRARVFPAMLALVPIPVSIICLTGGSSKVATSVVTIAFSSGAAFALSRVARDAGKRLEKPLFEKWGGAPTTQLLRHSNSLIDSITKARYHLILAKGIGQKMPTVAQEDADPLGADEHYSAAVIWLLGKTRDTKQFPLVFKENVAYGFHRNAFGMRLVGIPVAIGAGLATLFSVGSVGVKPPYFSPPNAESLSPERLISLGVALAMLIAWTFAFREASVRSAAFAYGIRLLECCDKLKAAVTSTARRQRPKPRGKNGPKDI